MNKKLKLSKKEKDLILYKFEKAANVAGPGTKSFFSDKEFKDIVKKYNPNTSTSSLDANKNDQSANNGEDFIQAFSQFKELTNQIESMMRTSSIPGFKFEQIQYIRTPKNNINDYTNLYNSGKAVKLQSNIVMNPENDDYAFGTASYEDSTLKFESKITNLLKQNKFTNIEFGSPMTIRASESDKYPFLEVYIDIDGMIDVYISSKKTFKNTK